MDVTNRGTGAGGSKTNENGKTFERKTDNESRLLLNGFTKKKIPGAKSKYGYYLENADNTCVYMTQGGLKAYFRHFFKKDMFRSPDEAYLFRTADSYVLKILEKKNQNVEGSVDTKLLAGPGFIEEYQECLGPDFKIVYAFCISAFLKKDYTSETLKYRILRKINEKHGISVLFGDDETYYSSLDIWINDLSGPRLSLRQETESESHDDTESLRSAMSAEEVLLELK